ncbi:1-phosphatidylinositol 4-kinase STT4 [Lachancea thermotolerans CBS 6340]|uniref:1-phosphatidylinositol 4-kinase n=1 Tax=Lachancea thermotolerans (strain ATCC 56472 / CBS 6340 / NRRL Y-8284) TaxID=559295 RepID=C5DGA2_LACTC|nr:KLTH0D03608p [Lachancea thermotolerans CBS 6340]CAR22444.1 KLTH0D03608p [Lachancea thermotolerans CBS 6340]
MSAFRESPGSLRALALAKLVNHSEGSRSIDKLVASLPVSYSSHPAKLYTIPLTLNELEVLLGVCQFVPSTAQSAQSLLKKCIIPYFLSNPRQKFTDYVINKYRQRGLKHPTEILSFELSRSIIRISRIFPQFIDEIREQIDEYLQYMSSNLTVENLLSFAGFLEALVYEQNNLLSSFVISVLQAFISEDFLYAVEKTVRNSVSKDVLIDYFDHNREISSLLFCELIEKLQVTYAASLLNVPKKQTLDSYLLDLKHAQFLDGENKALKDFEKKVGQQRSKLLELCKFSFRQITEVEEGAKYIDLSSQNRLESAYTAKSYMLQILSLGLFLSHEVEEVIEMIRDAVIDLPTNSFALKTSLLTTVVCVASLLNYFTDSVSADLLRVFPLMVTTKLITKQKVATISSAVSKGLKPLTEDVIVGTIYNINNLLALAQDGLHMTPVKDRRLTTVLGTSNHFDRLLSSRPTRSNTVGTYQSLQKLKIAETSIVLQHESKLENYTSRQEEVESNSTLYHDSLYENVVTATTTMASVYNDQSITALTITILTQKIKSASPRLDRKILEGLAHLALKVNRSEFNLLMKFFHLSTNSALDNQDEKMMKSLIAAKSIIAEGLAKEDLHNNLFRIYLRYLLDAIVARGDVDRSEHHRSHSEISKVADQIAVYLKPLASLLPKPGEKPLDLIHDEEITNVFRNVWFNAAVHGFHGAAALTSKNHEELLVIAYNSPPLASDFASGNRETSLDMNTILRRGSSNHNLKQQKLILSDHLSMSPVQARTLSSSKVMFLAATLLLEGLRCEAGDCSKTLLYCSDRSIVKSGLDKFVSSISVSMVQRYTKLVIKGDSVIFSAENVAKQLDNILLLLTHRDAPLQDAAYQSCDRFIERIPSSLCHRDSLYTLLDSLTMLFDSVIACEANKHEAVFEFTLKHSNRKMMLPDSLNWRSLTLEKLQKYATRWVTMILKTANQDTKILLQSYISDVSSTRRLNSIEFGVSFALEMAAKILPVDRELANISQGGYRRPDSISGFLSQHAWRSRFIMDQSVLSTYDGIEAERNFSRRKILAHLENKKPLDYKDISAFLDLSASLLILRQGNTASLVYDIVCIPFQIFTSDTIKIATNVWLSVINERSDVGYLLLSEIGHCWRDSIDNNTGLFSMKHNLVAEEFQYMEYSPYNKKEINRRAHAASKSLQPHLQLIRFLSSHFEGTMFDSLHLLHIFTKLCLYGLKNLGKASLHPFARIARSELLYFGTLVFATNVKHNTLYVPEISRFLVDGALTWFEKPKSWPFGANELKIRADLALLIEVYRKLKSQEANLKVHCSKDVSLLEHFLLSEIYSVETWLRPLAKPTDMVKPPTDLVSHAFKKKPELAINLVERYPFKKSSEILTQLVKENPLLCAHSQKTLSFFLAGGKDMHYVLYWAPASPLKSINLFLPQWAQNTFVIQYNVRAIETHDVNLTFFYVPQIVQCLRYDPLGYVERFIIDTAKISVLFSHQIIWNMLANSYKDDDGEIPDDLKPTLDRIHDKMLASFSAEQKDFYEREFSFFNEVTGISGKLRPYIKKTKAEKKIKIDEEMQKISVLDGVYLPSNPDGVVVDIDRSSGKPLQSHAKAPFMATFKIEKTEQDPDTGEDKKVEKWQGAIFKVGDDCRQDVLALQLISLFRTIWSAVGLDVFVFPYRVTATAPGCGVIDVLPNSISRDMLGREAVNGLYEYFTTKFGHENTVEFQHARNNFVKSLAGYSVISELLQFKDRHNGNIMYDDQGHCLHIDFGFIFDIVPGGVKFEAVPFKLTKEMVKVMGGSPDTQAYREFEELCIKAYLAARPHMDLVLECVTPMLGSGLPCFNGNKTIRNLESRFVPHKTDYEAAQHMLSLIKKSYESLFTKGYDEFQRLTNGIPY